MFDISKAYVQSTDFDITRIARRIHFQVDCAFNTTRLIDHIPSSNRDCRWFSTKPHERARTSDKKRATLVSTVISSTIASVAALAGPGISTTMRLAGKPTLLTVIIIQRQPSQSQI